MTRPEPEPLKYDRWREMAFVRTSERIYGKPPTSCGQSGHGLSVKACRTVYRLWDEAGRLLYVGWTEHFEVQMHVHRESSPWWPEVASYQVDIFETRPEALTPTEEQ